MQKRSLLFRGALMVLIGTVSIAASAQDDSKEESQEKQVQEKTEFDSVKELQADYNKRYSTFMKAARAAGRDMEKRKEAMELLPDTSAYIAGLQEFAETNPKSKQLEGALFGVMRQARTAKDRKIVMDLILDNFIDSKRMTRFVTGLRGDENAIRRIYEESSSDDVKAVALYSLIGVLESKKSRAKDNEEVAQELADVTAMFIERYPDKEDSRGVTYVARLEGQKFAAERLQIGMPVPDIVGEDVDGVEFKLSDYKGKVVVIDFWGDW